MHAFLRGMQTLIRAALQSKTPHLFASENPVAVKHTHEIRRNGNSCYKSPIYKL